MTTFATNLRRLRQDAGITQAELAVVTGIHVAQISHYECSQREPSLANLRALQEALDCDYKEFFKCKQQ